MSSQIFRIFSVAILSLGLLSLVMVIITPKGSSEFYISVITFIIDIVAFIICIVVYKKRKMESE